jgi:hypothetical protein
MLRKPRNARTGRLTDWKFFIQIYLVGGRVDRVEGTINAVWADHGLDDVAMRHVDVVLVYEPARAWIL